ncbi:hypothetical protein JTE90_014055 [Oedothorax gibbosus]|uniref:MADF domain-containing protein n=1 Tax=Oedothorax gibbosus TaxID=931172 RepID=A0AAV6V3X6_9ARAC|nr:hypothetical protein JTE90_014055 [Oedothorax gibbosus]
MADSEDFEFDAERFIDEVRNQPAIWDPDDEGYHTKQKKREAWLEICRAFCDGYDQKNEQHRSEICNRLIKKWRNLKDSFMKHTKKQKNVTAVYKKQQRPYIYQKNLSFLNKWDDDSESSFGKKDEDEPDNSDENTAEMPTRASTKKRKVQQSIICSSAQGSAGGADQNADRLFFESLLPYMASFTEDQKLEFRCEVLNVVKKIKTQHSDCPAQNYNAASVASAQELSSPYTSYDLPQHPNHKTFNQPPF